MDIRHLLRKINRGFSPHTHLYIYAITCPAAAAAASAAAAAAAAAAVTVWLWGNTGHTQNCFSLPFADMENLVMPYDCGYFSTFEWYWIGCTRCRKCDYLFLKFTLIYRGKFLILEIFCLFYTFDIDVRTTMFFWCSCSFWHSNYFLFNSCLLISILISPSTHRRSFKLIIISIHLVTEN